MLDALDKEQEIHGRRHEAYVAATAACEQKEAEVDRVGDDADSEASEGQRGASLEDAGWVLWEAAGSASCGRVGASYSLEHYGE